MKRPQFSIKAVLLVVALAGSLFAWRRNAIDLHQRLIQERRMELETKLNELQRARKDAIILDRVTYDWFNSKMWVVTPRVSDLDAQITQANKELEATNAIQ